MSMKLDLNIPIDCNDMSDTGLSAVYMEIKKLAEQLEFLLSNINEKNMTDDYNEKIKSLSETEKAYREEVKDRENRKFRVKIPTTVTTQKIYSDAVKANSLISIFPDSDYIAAWREKRVYVSEIGKGYFNLKADSGFLGNCTVFVQEGVSDT